MNQNENYNLFDKEIKEESDDESFYNDDFMSSGIVKEKDEKDCFTHCCDASADFDEKDFDFSDELRHFIDEDMDSKEFFSDISNSADLLSSSNDKSLDRNTTKNNFFNEPVDSFNLRREENSCLSQPCNLFAAASNLLASTKNASSISWENSFMETRPSLSHMDESSCNESEPISFQGNLNELPLFISDKNKKFKYPAKFSEESSNSSAANYTNFRANDFSLSSSQPSNTNFEHKGNFSIGRFGKKTTKPFNAPLCKQTKKPNFLQLTNQKTVVSQQNTPELKSYEKVDDSNRNAGFKNESFSKSISVKYDESVKNYDTSSDNVPPNKPRFKPFKPVFKRPKKIEKDTTDKNLPCNSVTDSEYFIKNNFMKTKENIVNKENGMQNTAEVRTISDKTTTYLEPKESSLTTVKEDVLEFAPSKKVPSKTGNSRNKHNSNKSFSVKPNSKFSIEKPKTYVKCVERFRGKLSHLFACNKGKFAKFSEEHADKMSLSNNIGVDKSKNIGINPKILLNKNIQETKCLSLQEGSESETLQEGSESETLQEGSESETLQEGSESETLQEGSESEKNENFESMQTEVLEDTDCLGKLKSVHGIGSLASEKALQNKHISVNLTDTLNQSQNDETGTCKTGTDGNESVLSSFEDSDIDNQSSKHKFSKSDTSDMSIAISNDMQRPFHDNTSDNSLFVTQEKEEKQEMVSVAAIDNQHETAENGKGKISPTFISSEQAKESVTTTTTKPKEFRSISPKSKKSKPSTLFPPKSRRDEPPKSLSVKSRKQRSSASKDGCSQRSHILPKKKDRTNPKKPQKVKALSMRNTESASKVAEIKKRLFDLQEKMDFPVWVQCDNCQKWRCLRDVMDPAVLPNVWKCSLNTDDKYSSCSFPEEDFDQEEHNEYFIFNNFTLGSVVWVTSFGPEWWPAMVDDDPDTETFFWLSSSSNIPRVKNALTSAISEATLAMSLPLIERRRKYCFATRYNGEWFSESENQDDQESS